MAGFNERFPMTDQVWFDAANPAALHDALRTDFARTKLAVERRPSLKRHVGDCPVCRAIIAAVGSTPAPTAARRRIKLVITPEAMHRMLRLPENFEIVHMFAVDDPNSVGVLVAGDGLPEADPLTETPTVSPDDVVRAARHGTS